MGGMSMSSGSVTAEGALCRCTAAISSVVNSNRYVSMSSAPYLGKCARTHTHALTRVKGGRYRVCLK